MSQFNPDYLVETLQWRYATKRFDPTRKISSEQWEILAETLRLAPSSYGLQPWKFLVVQRPALREKLKDASWNQSQVADCSHFVVFTHKTSIDQTYIDRFISEGAKTRNVDPQTMAAYRGMMEGDLIRGPRSKLIPHWAQRQCYIALGFLLETAALLQIDACPMEGLDAAKYDELLNLEGTGYATVVAAALGYRHPEDKYQFMAKLRFPADEIIQYID